MVASVIASAMMASPVMAIGQSGTAPCSNRECQCEYTILLHLSTLFSGPESNQQRENAAWIPAVHSLLISTLPKPTVLSCNCLSDWHRSRQWNSLATNPDRWTNGAGQLPHGRSKKVVEKRSNANHGDATVKTDTSGSGIRMTLADGKTVVGGQAIMTKVLQITFQTDRMAEEFKKRPRSGQPSKAA